MARRAEYEGPMESDVDKMEAQLARWAALIDDLAEKADRGAQIKIDYRLRIDDLKVKRAVAQARLNEFKAADGGKRAELKPGTERAWSELESALRDLKL